MWNRWRQALKILCADWYTEVLMHALPPKRVCSESRDLFKFWEISDTILYNNTESMLPPTVDRWLRIMCVLMVSLQK